MPSPDPLTEAGTRTGLQGWVGGHLAGHEAVTLLEKAAEGEADAPRKADPEVHSCEASGKGWGSSRQSVTGAETMSRARVAVAA